jgi:hypothetical protein
MKLAAIRMSWRTAALVCVNVLILATVGLRLWRGTQADMILQAPVHRLKVPALRLELPPPYANFSGLTDRTPFYATRKLYVLPSKSEASAPPVPNYLFGGAVIRPHAPAVALLNSTNGGTLKVTAGQDLNGWHVESVEVSRVVLRYEEQRAEIARERKTAIQSAAAEGLTRAPVTRGNRVPPGGVRVLGDGQAVSRAAPAAANLPPLAGSGSGSVYIPPPPR